MKKDKKVVVTVTMEEMTKARAMQVAIKHDRKSLSDTIDWLIKLGIKAVYKGVVEPTITDPKQFIEIHK